MCYQVTSLLAWIFSFWYDFCSFRIVAFASGSGSHLPSVNRSPPEMSMEVPLRNPGACAPAFRLVMAVILPGAAARNLRWPTASTLSRHLGRSRPGTRSYPESVPPRVDTLRRLLLIIMMV